ncbi:hypothetical protein DFJ74DRAFT_711871 [Hyaloraphidium curvatum]|nr:hypothetical protein DFJ74DRAFT_711871 [Hyaloraphidium curvatum]
MLADCAAGCARLDVRPVSPAPGGGPATPPSAPLVPVRRGGARVAPLPDGPDAGGSPGTRRARAGGRAAGEPRPPVEPWKRELMRFRRMRGLAPVPQARQLLAREAGSAAHRGQVPHPGDAECCRSASSSATAVDDWEAPEGGEGGSEEGGSPDSTCFSPAPGWLRRPEPASPPRVDSDDDPSDASPFPPPAHPPARDAPALASLPPLPPPPHATPAHLRSRSHPPACCTHPPPDTYPADLLVSTIISSVYASWYPPSAAGAHVRHPTLFSSDQPAFAAYLGRLLAHARPSAYVVSRAMGYVRELRRRVKTEASFAVGSHYAVAAVSLLLAAKAVDDARHSISRWAHATAIPGATLRRMELEFADFLDWKL